MATVLVTVAITTVSIVAGQWQYDRYTVRSQAQDAYERASRAPVEDFDQLMDNAASVPLNLTWRTVTVRGSYEPDTLTVLRNRPVNSIAATHAIAWFVTLDGHALAVNAGWAPSSGAQAQVLDSLPTGDVTARVVLREWEEDDGRRDSGATRIAPEQLPAPPAEPYPGYGMVRHDCEPGPGCAVPRDTREVPVPSLGTGPHLSYAFQWWVFAALAPLGAALLLRRDSAGALPARTPPPASSRPSRELSDEEVEDAL